MLTLRPRAARLVTLPGLRGHEDRAPRQRRVLDGSRERPPLWILVPAIAIAIFELLPLLYLLARTLDAGQAASTMLLRAKTLEVMLNTVVLAGMPRGQHKVLIELVDAEVNAFTAETVTFHSPGKELRP